MDIYQGNREVNTKETPASTSSIPSRFTDQREMNLNKTTKIVSNPTQTTAPFAGRSRVSMRYSAVILGGTRPEAIAAAMIGLTYWTSPIVKPIREV
jgi:hypothetical protein